MFTDLTKEEKKEPKENQKNWELKKDLSMSGDCNSNNKTKGLTVAIDNRVLEHYSKPLKEGGKGFKMKHIGRLFTLMILNKTNELNKHVPFELIATMLELNTNVSDRRLKSDVRKALKELYPTIEYVEDPVKGIKFTHIPKENYTEKGKTSGFTQLCCDLLKLDNNDVTVLFTVLEYFNGRTREVKPSIATIMSMCGCAKREKINNLLKEYQVTDEKKGVWKIISSKGGSKQNTNRYELSYTTEEGLERYYFLDFLEEIEETDLDDYLEEVQ